MFIRGVTLRNIRSYEELDLAFDEGITLLTGDIGAGKTTILAAIEFALFGLQRTILDGDALLRHGADDGSVALTFGIDQREITITRSLRRTANGVRQTDGSLSIDGSLETLSAQELKARVLELLGYPEALLTKSKGLVFRHTVYTPQEDMKAILWLPVEERLNTLRTLFGIERYKTITQNAALVVRELRAEERTHLAHATNLVALEREQQDSVQRLIAAKKRHADAQRTLDAATLALTKYRETLAHARAENDAALKTEADRMRFSQRVRELERSVLNATEDLAHTNELLERVPEPIPDCSVELDVIRSEQQVLDRELRALTATVAEAATERKIRLNQANAITTMDACPVCKQQVTSSHKHTITQETDALLSSLARTTESATEREYAVRTRHTALAQKLLSLTEQQRRFSGYQKELLARAEHERQHTRFHTRLETLTRDLAQARHDLAQVAPLDGAARERYTLAEETARAAEELREERLRTLRATESDVSAATATAATIAERLAAAKTAHAAAIIVQSRRSWLEETFLPAVTTVEAHVLASVQREFAELFASHFTALIEDDTIAVSLGEQFEPLVTQNGYDATLEQLSGGEKTAVALSYRLALYRVVSDFLRTITTRDILILDEPTDGFSTEQLARVRDVIRSLGCRQVILVSHEQGMESACDHVIKVSKRLHRSSVLA